MNKLRYFVSWPLVFVGIFLTTLGVRINSGPEAARGFVDALANLE